MEGAPGDADGDLVARAELVGHADQSLRAEHDGVPALQRSDGRQSSRLSSQPGQFPLLIREAAVHGPERPGPQLVDLGGQPGQEPGWVAQRWAATRLVQPNLRDWVTEDVWLPRVDGALLGQSFFNLFTYNVTANAGYAELRPTSLPPPPTPVRATLSSW